MGMVACLLMVKRVRAGFLDQEGQYLVYTALILPLMIVLLGLVVDGGFMFRGYRRAVNVASLSAQAASHAVDATHFSSTNRVQLDRARAFNLAQEYAARNSRGEVSLRRVSVWGDRVLVEVEARVPTVFMRIVGISEVRLRAISLARPRYGIESIDQ